MIQTTHWLKDIRVVLIINIILMIHLTNATGTVKVFNILSGRMHMIRVVKRIYLTAKHMIISQLTQHLSVQLARMITYSQ